jgi:tetratricopeptide (TPR) repeat protein
MQPGVPHWHQPPTFVWPANATVEKAAGLVGFSLREGENKSGRANMHTVANTNRFLTGCPSSVRLTDLETVVSRGGSIQHIVVSHLAQTLNSQKAFLKLTNALTHFAEQAYILRDLNALQEVSRVLMNLPVDAARQIGMYYHALAIKRKGLLDEAQTLLETVADNAPLNFRARALQGLGALHYDKGQLNETLRFQLEALRAASDKNAHGLQTTLMARLEIAIIKSLGGDHKAALFDLRSFRPLLNLVAKQKPFYFYLHLNELAVEFAEIGRLPEAEAASAIALASPFARAYPEWSETRDEIAAKRQSATPSVVAVNRAPAAEPSPQVQPQPKPQRSRSRLSKWLAVENTLLQRPLITTAPIATIAGAQIAQNILDRVLVCHRSRAPTANR